jgi:hypothetical protein
VLPAWTTPRSRVIERREVGNPSAFDHLSDAEVEAQFIARIIEIFRDPEIRQQVVRGLAGVGLSLRDFEEELTTAH